MPVRPAHGGNMMRGWMRFGADATDSSQHATRQPPPGSQRCQHPRRRRRQISRQRIALLEQLEARQLLAVASPPSEPLSTVAGPQAVESGSFYHHGQLNAHSAIVLGSSGELTLAHRAPTSDQWSAVDQLDLNIADPLALAVARLNLDPATDIVVRAPAALHVLHATPTGFTEVQTLPLRAPPPTLDSSSASPAPPLDSRPSTLDFFSSPSTLDASSHLDLVVAVPENNSVLVYPGQLGGTFAGPVTYATNHDQPISVAVGDLIGDPLPDLVVGHVDGAVVFFAGQLSDTGAFTFQRNDELTLFETTAVTDLEVADFDGDGVSDLAVVAEQSAAILYGSADPLPTSPLVNGDFSSGLTGWNTEIVGHATGAKPGSVTAIGGRAQLREHESFLTSLQQTIVIPAGATTISFELVGLGLDPVFGDSGDVRGAIPDAFEVSLLDHQQRSLVPTHHPDSTAFFNLSAGAGQQTAQQTGQQAAASSLAAGVTLQHSIVTVEINGLTAGSEATLVFDLIGNPPGTSSVASIDNVTITPDSIVSNQLTRVPLDGDLTFAVDAETGDVDGDGRLDLVIADAVAGTLVVFQGLPSDNTGNNRQFTRSQIELSSFGGQPSAIAIGPLTSKDSIDDIVVTLRDSDLLLSPIGSSLTLAAPADVVTDEGSAFTLTTTFADSSGLASHEATMDWGDGVTSDADVVFDAGSATGQIAADHVYADDGDYTITVRLRNAGDGAVTATTSAVVGGVAPTVTPVAVPDLTAGSQFSGLLATFTDPGFDNVSLGTTESFTANIDWGDGSAVETNLPVATVPGAPGVPTSGSLNATHTFAVAGEYVVSMTVRDDDGLSQQTSLTVTVSADDSGQPCRATLDFGTSAGGQPLTAGEVVSDQWADWGIHISSHDPLHHPVMIFDSSQPTGSDFDLGSPHEDFGGPGQGKGGRQGAAGENATSLGNLLIISEDADASDPDDRAAGGTLAVDFDEPAELHSLTLIDIDANEATSVVLIDAAGQSLATIDVIGLGNNAVQTVTLATAAVARIEIRFAGSGGLAELVFCDHARSSGNTTHGGSGNNSGTESGIDPVDDPIPPPATRFYVIDSRAGGADAHRYDTLGMPLGEFSAVTSTNSARSSALRFNPRGLATTGDGNPLWILSDDGAAGRVHVFDTQGEVLLGSWVANTLAEPQGIATDGTDIWIVDAATNRVQRYAGAADRRSGHQFRADSFGLAFGNRDPTGITTDGQTIWVVDEVSDKVFVYDLAGNSLNWWQLDPENRDPRGITIDPSGGPGVWVVDGEDARVYHYAQATLSELGGQTALDSFPLAAGNTDPQGIADPDSSQPLHFDTVYSGQISEPGETDEYLFDVTAGETIYFDVEAFSGGFIRTRLIAPDGTQVFSSLSSSLVSADEGPLVLDQSGTYRLLWNGFSDATPSYTFRVNLVPPPDVRPLEIDQVYAGQIETAGVEDHWTFTGEPGQTLYFDTQSLSGGSTRVRLFDPAGNQLFQHSNLVTRLLDHGPLTIDQPGTYTLKYDAPSGVTPGYSFRVWDVAPTLTTTLPLGEIVSGEIETPGTQDVYTFEAAAGTQIFFDMQQVWQSERPVNETVNTRLFAPGGDQLFAETDFLHQAHDRGPLELTETGTYTLQFRGFGDNIPGFQFRVDDVTPAPASTITLDQNVAGAIELGGRSHAYTFTATAGDELTLDVLLSQVVDSLKGPTAGFTLLAPSGASLFEQSIDDTTFTADETGDYRLVVDDRGFVRRSDITGRYSFRLVDDPAVPAPEVANLVVSNVVADTVSIGDPAEVEVSWTVTNQGTATAASWDGTAWLDQIIFSADEDPDTLYDRVMATSEWAGELAPGESYEQSMTVWLPPGSQGGFWIYVQTDALNKVPENEPVIDNLARSATFSAVYRQPRPLGDGPPLELAPPDHSRYPAGTSLALSGSVGATTQSINAIFVVDVSTSTLAPAELDANGDGVVDLLDDVNDFPNVGDVLDAEIAAALRLTEQLELLSDNVRVATVMFAGGSEPVDSGPELFNQHFVDPATDTTYRDDDSNFETAIRSLWSQSLGFASLQGARKFRDNQVDAGTLFDAPLRDLANLLATAPPAERTLVYLLTDGVAFDKEPVDVQDVAAAGIEFYAFQIGGAAVTPELDAVAAQIDATAESSGLAVPVSDPETLTAQLLETLDVQSVTVNGVPVAALDPAGNFFTAVNLAAGANVFEVVATTAAGGRTESSITLYGDTLGPLLDLSALEPATAGVEAAFRGTTFNRETNQLHVELAADNESVGPILPPLVAVFAASSRPAIEVVSPEQVTAAGQSAFVFDAEIAPQLAVGSTSDPIAVALENPLRERFSVEIEFLTAGNTAPVYTSVPELIAPFDELYTHPVSWLDPDDDAVLVELLEGPATMVLATAGSGSAASGTDALSWTPTAADVGHHRVTLRLTDGRGGQADRQFTLLVPSGLDNGPPLILSDPPRHATIDEPLVYAITTADPERQPVTLSLASGAPVGMELVGGILGWTPTASDVGKHSITVLASDSGGGVGHQTFELTVLGVNTPPQFITVPVTELAAGQRYLYPALATDSDDLVSYKIAGPAGLTIGAASGLVRWPGEFTTSGDYPITITATDARGLTATQPYTLTITPDTTPPDVSIVLSESSIDVGGAVQLRVVGRDNVAVNSLSLLVDGVPIPLDVDGRATLTPATSGIVRLLASAVDTSGNEGAATAALIVIDPADVTPPVALIETPAGNATVEYLTDVTGTVTDDALVSYRLEVSLIHSAQWRPIAAVSALDAAGPIDVTSGLLGVFDPTLLKNNQYDLRLTATDISGNTAVDTVRVNLDGNAKIGVNEQAIVDLTIPVAGGPPIQISRSHSQLTANESGDFGNGWQFCAADADLRESVARTPFEDLLGQFAALPFRDGDKVYVTTPDCQRVGFTFSPVPHTGLWSTLGDDFFDPRFIPDPGVDWRLYGENDFTRITSISSGEFDLGGLPLPLLRYQDNQFIIAAVSTAYNPLGYQLINKQGVRYHYNDAGELQDVSDRNGNTLEYSDDAITSSSGQQVQFERDEQGRITTLIDPAGNQIDYTYDESGNLVDVSYPEGLSNSYRYTAENYLAAVNPESLPDQESTTLGFEYDVAGRLAVVLDALGATNSFEYELGGNRRRTYDALGFVTEMTYDDRGNMISHISANGDTVGYQYDAADNLTVLTDERGFDTVMAYDERRNLTSMTDALGYVTAFTYNAANDLTRMVDGDGGVREYDFDAAGNMIATRAPGGADATIKYDSRGRVIQVTDVDGNSRRLEYEAGPYPTKYVERDGSFVEMTVDAHGHIRSFTDPRGFAMTITMDRRQRPVAYTDALGHSMTFEYDGSRVERVIDQLGNQTEYILDSNDRPIQIIDPEGGVMVMTYDPNGRQSSVTDANGNKTTYAYRPDGRMLSMTDALGGVMTYEYDPVGNQTAVVDAKGHRWQWEYDPLNYVFAAVTPTGDRTEFAYDAMGNLSAETDPLGRITSYEYGDLQLATRIVDAAGGVVELAYDWQGNLTSERDRNGNLRSYVYDVQSRLVEVTDPVGNTMSYEYDDANNRTAVVDERGNRTEITYDPLNRPLVWTDPAGQMTEFAYDAKGRTTRIVDHSGASRSFVYDKLGRTVRDVDPLGGEMSWAYDAVGNVRSATDRIGRSTTIAYDPLNRRVSTTDPLGAVTRFGYDAVGNLMTLTDPELNETSFTYDAMNRIVASTNALEHAATTAYDAAGNIIELVDRNGRIRTFEHDLRNRVTAEAWWVGDQPVNRLEYGYDSVGNLLTASDKSSQYSFSYDALNRQLLVDNGGTTGVPRVLLTHTFDAVGNRTRISDNSGVNVESVYDERDLLSRRSWEGGGIDAASLHHAYDERGLPTELSRFASADDSVLVSRTAYRFDAKARLVDLTHSDAVGAVLVDYDYVRDLADQLIRESHHGGTREYTRDDFGQLISATVDGLARESYAYDQNGNRADASMVTGSDNRMLEDVDYVYTYDPEGNLIRRTDKATGAYREYTYDHRNRLTLADDYDADGGLVGQVVNVFDVLDRRIGRSHDADGDGPLAPVQRNTVYDGPHAWTDFDGQGAVTARYLFGDGIDQITARWRPGDGTAWYLTDHLSTVRELIDSDGQVINTIDYDSFGRILGQSNAAVGDRFAFTGREWDEALDLYYYRARFYDPVTGRFTSQDPIGFSAGDANLYRYVGNNPLDYIDPSGNAALTECAFVRNASTALSIACPTTQAVLNGAFNLDGFKADALNSRAVEAVLNILNVTATILPHGSAPAFQLVMKAVTFGTTVNALANSLANGQLFNIIGMAETWVREASRLVDQGVYATFQEALEHFGNEAKKPMFWSEIVCGAANLALLVYSRKAQCFVAGTPIVVGIQAQPAFVRSDTDELDSQTVMAGVNFELTTLDLLAGVALAGAASRIGRRRRDQRTKSLGRACPMQSTSANNDFEFESQLFNQAADTVFASYTGARLGEIPNEDEFEYAAPTPTEPVFIPPSCPPLVPASMPRPSGATIPARGKGSWTGSVLIIASCLLLASLCLLPRLAREGDVAELDLPAHTQAAALAAGSWGELSTRPIETIRCGDRVMALYDGETGAPSESVSLASSASPSRPVDEAIEDEFGQPDPASWRLVELELTKASGDTIEVHLLRPLAWLAAGGAVRDREFGVQVEELDIEGDAAVLRILPCPVIERGDGQIVTGTFRHTSDHLVELSIEGERAPITCTDGHPIWSESKQAFIPAGDLASGESLRRIDGSLARLHDIHHLEGTREVFNLEVGVVHTYHVGLAGVLVHNSLARCNDDNAKGPKDLDEFSDGTFSITEEGFTGYPEGIPRPEGPFRLLEGAEYDAARKTANKANRAIRKANPEGTAGKEIHEIQPIKFGGSPTDPANRIPLRWDLHRKQVTPWWNRLMKSIQNSGGES